MDRSGWGLPSGPQPTSNSTDTNRLRSTSISDPFHLHLTEVVVLPGMPKSFGTTHSSPCWKYRTSSLALNIGCWSLMGNPRHERTPPLFAYVVYSMPSR